MAKINLDLLKKLHSQGKSNREIARSLQVHHNTIAYHLKQNGMQCNIANQPIEMVSNTEARCKKCLEIKPIIEFQFGRKGQKYEYRFSYCKDCRKKQLYLNLNQNPEKFLADRYNRLVLRARKNNIVCTISKQEFIDQFHKQNGLCFYTDEKLVCEVGSKLHRDSLSIDKIYTDRGYINGNVVFATHRINTCKNDLSLDEIQKWMPNWSERIQKFLENSKIY